MLNEHAHENGGCLKIILWLVNLRHMHDVLIKKIKNTLKTKIHLYLKSTNFLVHLPSTLSQNILAQNKHRVYE